MADRKSKWTQRYVKSAGTIRGFSMVEMWTSDQNKSHGVLIFESSKRWICNHIRQVESEREICQYTHSNAGRRNRESFKGIQPANRTSSKA